MSVREAAERLRRLKTCKETSQGIYGVEFDRYDQGSVIEAGNRVKYLILQDEKSVIDVYLSEHPADDGEPITKEWFRSASITSNNWMHGDGIDIYQDSLGRISVCLVDECQVLPHVKTRGDVRRLCKALSVSLVRC